MSTERIHRFIGCAFASTLVGLSTLVCLPANAAHEPIFAVDQNNNLFSFWSDAPGTILTQYAISGIQNAEEIRALDYWNGTIYGLGSFSHLYTLNPNTGVATMVGAGFSPLLNGATFGADNGPAGLQVVSGLGQNLLVNRATASVTADPSLHYSAGDPFFGVAPRVDALAYDGATGIWYADDTLQNTLATFDPITGVLSTIGFNGIDAARFNGMDISPVTGIMYADTPAASSDPQANLYTVNKVTGMVTLVGLIGSPGDGILVRGLTVVPIPEPNSLVLLALGVCGVLIAHRRLH
jgi:hypothetical protein